MLLFFQKSQVKRLFYGLLATFFFQSIHYSNVYASPTTSTLPTFINPDVIVKMNIFFAENKILFNGLIGFLLTTSVAIFMIHFIRLGRYGDHPLVRHKIIHDLMISGICTACLGSIWIIFGLLVYTVLG